MLDVFHRLLGAWAVNWQILALIVALGVGLSLVQRVRWSRQNAAVNVAAKDFGFVPLGILPIGPEELKSFHFPLGLGKTHNILGGSLDGREVVLFDTEVGHPHGDPTLQTIAGFKLTVSKLPDFTLCPKNVVGRLLSAFGKAVEFDDDSGFSRDYFVTAVDQSALRATFTLEFREFFASLERYDSAKSWHVQKRGPWVLIYRKDEGAAPDELQTFLDAAAEIIRNLDAASHNAQLA